MSLVIGDDEPHLGPESQVVAQEPTALISMTTNSMVAGRDCHPMLNCQNTLDNHVYPPPHTT